MAELRAKCPSCPAFLRVINLSLAGKLVKCPKCGTPIRLPAEASPATASATGVATNAVGGKKAVTARAPGKTSPTPPDEEDLLREEAAVTKKPARGPRKTADVDEEVPEPGKKGKKAKKSSSTGVLILAGVALLLLLGAGGVGVLFALGYFADVPQTKRVVQNPPPPGPLGPIDPQNPGVPGGNLGEPDFKLTAEEFNQELGQKGKEKEAKEKYKGKVIELTGKVKGGGKAGGGAVYFTLDVPKNLVGVQCFPTDPNPWARITPGQEVRVRGKLPEFSLFTSLVECEVVEVTGEAAPPLAAPQLAKEYAADPEATNTRYKDRWVVVTGEVVEKKANDVGAVKVFLKTDDKVKVLCSFTAFDKDDVAKIEVGARVRILGEYSRLVTESDDEVGLFTSIYLGPAE